MLTANEPIGMQRLDESKHTNGRYQLHHKLGEGGMGIVYLATDRLAQEHVAFKQVQLNLFCRDRTGQFLSVGMFYLCQALECCKF